MLGAAYALSTVGETMAYWNQGQPRCPPAAGAAGAAGYVLNFSLRLDGRLSLFGANEALQVMAVTIFGKRWLLGHILHFNWRSWR